VTEARPQDTALLLAPGVGFHPGPEDRRKHSGQEALSGPVSGTGDSQATGEQ
jgi:hypothetical protein